MHPAPQRPRRPARSAVGLLRVLCIAALGACVPPVHQGPGPVGPPEARSLFGRPLYSPELPLDQRQRLELQLDSARQAYERNPDDAEALLWYGRRTAALGHYREAVGLFSEGIERHPRDARFYRFRGHRWITLRRFDRAVADLTRAARLTHGVADVPEPDLMPGPGGPSGTLQGSIWYHLGIAHYLRGEFGRAAVAFRAALGLARSDDARVAATDWLYMALRRGGRPADAEAVLTALGQPAAVNESGAYLRRIRLYRGELPPDSLLDPAGRNGVDLATQAYGVGNWYLYNGHPAEAQEVFWRVLAAENWAPFGYIAAEADLRRLARAQER